MAKLPLWPYPKVIKRLEQFGYVIARQKGSHIQMIHRDREPVTVPAHKPVARGTLRKILRDADIAADEFSR